MASLKVAFVCGLSDKKLSQKLAPLQAMPEVASIDVYRRHPFYGEKVRWVPMPPIWSNLGRAGDLWRLCALVKNARHYHALIGCHQRFHGVYAAIAGRIAAKPVIQLAITDPEWMLKNPLGKWALNKADAIGFRGNTTRNRFARSHGLNKVLFVPQNVWEPGPVVIPDTPKSIDLLYVGYLAGYKNIGAWLETAAEVKRRRGRLRAVMIGDRPNRRIRRLIKRWGIDDDVEFRGPLYGPALDRHYAQARVFLLTSRWEGLPMVLVEAMAAGVPVVAPAVGDIPELVHDGENGFLVGKGDVGTAAAAVHRLLDNRPLRLSMSEKAQATVKEFLLQSTCEKAARQWRQVFSRLGLLPVAMPESTPKKTKIESFL